MARGGDDLRARQAGEQQANEPDGTAERRRFHAGAGRFVGRSG
ncbi:hypothetical protein BURCENBC7_AP2823 [Burkholderia cenocepacia BC7]|nr:hypothetical protein BURCENK562V_C3474 [Burkholderia cenocepacia K56-2Valvano]ERI32258.1 hypothetical protein BURCENBC7_AP2823 [Burkholderia cenocepacia BC7]